LYLEYLQSKLDTLGGKHLAKHQILKVPTIYSVNPLNTEIAKKTP